MLKRVGCYSFLFLLVLFFLSGSAYALKFTGNAWLAQHYSDGQATGDFYLVIDNSGFDNMSRERLKGFKFKESSNPRDFYYLTGKPGTEGATYFEIDGNKKKLKKLTKKAMRKSNKLMNQGALDQADQAAWMDAYIEQKLEDKLFKLVFKDGDTKYKGKIGYATFENSVDYSEIVDQYPGSDKAAPVPEPSTMLLLGFGLLGVAGLRRRFIKS